MTKQEYENMTLTSLKEIAKKIGIKNISKYKKHDLIEEILRMSQNSIEKDGVILRENIAPKNNTQVKNTIEKVNISRKDNFEDAKQGESNISKE